MSSNKTFGELYEDTLDAYFQEFVRVQCWGCANNHPSQKYHMMEGGCLTFQ